MNRRGFLQALVALAAAPLAPITAKGEVDAAAWFMSDRGLYALIDEGPAVILGIDRATYRWWSTEQPGPHQPVDRAELERHMEKLWKEATA